MIVEIETFYFTIRKIFKIQEATKTPKGQTVITHQNNIEEVWHD